MIVEVVPPAAIVVPVIDGLKATFSPYWYWSAAEVALVPSAPACTCTWTVPVPEGTVAVRVVGESTVTLVAAFDPKVTLVTPTKPPPVTVTVPPP